MSKIDEKYHKLLQHIIDNGFKYEDPNRKDVYRYQIPSCQIEFNFKDGFPAITTKKLYWKGVVGELLWFLRGDTNIKYLVDNNINIWNKDAYNYYLKQFNGKYPKSPQNAHDLEGFISLIGNENSPQQWMKPYKFGDLSRVYGAQWRSFTGYESFRDQLDGSKDMTEYGVDQISNLIKGLKENPMGTRHIVTAWNPAELDEMALPPCHWSFEILVEPRECGHHVECCNYNQCNGEDFQFTLKWHQRSVDTFLGLPFNIASYALLAHIIGKMTNMIPKGIIGDLSNVHIYEPHMDAVKEQLSRDVNKYGECELDIAEGLVINLGSKMDINKKLNTAKITDFILRQYKSYPKIPAEMLPYNK